MLNYLWINNELFTPKIIPIIKKKRYNLWFNYHVVLLPINYICICIAPHSQHNGRPGVWWGVSCGKPGRQTCDLAIRSSHRVVPKPAVFTEQAPRLPVGALRLRSASPHVTAPLIGRGSIWGAPTPLFPPISDIRFLGRRVRRDRLWHSLVFMKFL